MHSATILQHLFASWSGFAALLATLILVRILAPVIQLRRLDAMRVPSALRGLDPATYRHFPDLQVPLPDGRGTLRIEHIVVSPFGIFMIDTTQRRGHSHQFTRGPEWFLRVLHRRNGFLDLMLDQRARVDALMKFLKLPDPPFRPVVVCLRGCAMQAASPEIVPADSLIHWIRQHKVTILDPRMVARSLARLEGLQETLHRETAEKPQLHALHVRQAV
jgi:hypothetical protein